MRLADTVLVPLDETEGLGLRRTVFIVPAVVEKELVPTTEYGMPLIVTVPLTYVTIGRGCDGILLLVVNVRLARTPPTKLSEAEEILAPGRKPVNWMETVWPAVTLTLPLVVNIMLLLLGAVNCMGICPVGLEQLKVKVVPVVPVGGALA